MLIMVDERSAALVFDFQELRLVLPHILSLYHIVGYVMHGRAVSQVPPLSSILSDTMHVHPTMYICDMCTRVTMCLTSSPIHATYAAKAALPWPLAL